MFGMSQQHVDLLIKESKQQAEDVASLRKLVHSLVELVEKHQRWIETATHVLKERG